MTMGKAALLSAFLLCLFISAAPARAARFSGEYLLTVCGIDREGKELVAGGHIACQAYIAGILDYHNLIRSMGAAPGIDFCVPETAGLTSIQKKVTSYVFKNRTQHEKFIAAPGVALALFTYFPCGK
ncbi:MAG: hypothetical protein K9G62_04550 [Alphaproteobacteria bacterium]|nr:hypothetical protein [Alphaproteobacteria bacterium]